MQKIEENKRQLAELEHQLIVAQRLGNMEKAQELKADTHLLSTENQNIKAFLQKQEYLQENLHRQPIYQKIRSNTGENAKLLTEDDWKHLDNILNVVYSEFTHRLVDLAELKKLELRVCFLLKIGTLQVDVGPMIGRTKSAVNMMCKRLYKKITHKEGTAKDFVSFIQNF